MQVTVIIVNHNGGEVLKRCVSALQGQTFQDFHVVIVDNGSIDGSMKSLLPLPASFEIIMAGENLGFARANNLAAHDSSAKWIATLNPDAIPAKDWLQQLMAAAQRHPEIVMFGSTQINATDPSILDGTGDAYHACGFAWRTNIGRPIVEIPQEGETFSPCAAAALYRREEFLAARGFDERFFCYCEDIDLAFRLRLQGHRCIQVPDAVVHHFGSAISGRYSEFTMYHGTRNRFWTFIKNMPGLLLLLLLPFHLFMHILFIFRAVMKGYAGALLRATHDMLLELKPVLIERRSVQRYRKVSVCAVVKMLTWSPFKILTRRG